MRRSCLITLCAFLGIWLPLLRGEPSQASERELAFVLDLSHPLHRSHDLRGIDVEVGGNLVASFPIRKAFHGSGNRGCFVLGRVPCPIDSEETVVTVRELLVSGKTTLPAQVRSALFELDEGLSLYWISYEFLSGGRSSAARLTLRLEKVLGAEGLERALFDLESESEMSLAALVVEIEVPIGLRRDLGDRRRSLDSPPLWLQVDGSVRRKLPFRVPLENPHMPTRYRLPYRWILASGMSRVCIEDPAVGVTPTLEVHTDPGELVLLEMEYRRTSDALFVELSRR